MDKSNPPFYTAKQINELRTAAQHYTLSAPSVFWQKTADELKYACNGAGPERWSEVKRRALTGALKQYEAAFAIHDVDFEYHIGSVKYANKRLRKNMLKIWRKNFGVFRWFKRSARVERLVVIPVIYAAVAIGGTEAWEECRHK